MAIDLKVPEVGESITEVEISDWLKSEGDSVAKDENLAVIETDKVTLELAAPADGILTKILKGKGERAAVGEVIAHIEAQAMAEGKPERPKLQTAAARPAEGPAAAEKPPERRVREMAPRAEEAPIEIEREPASTPPRQLARPAAEDRREEVVPMSRLRRRVAERLVAAQQQAALLTTFNEIDMSAVIALRRQYRDLFQEKYGIRLGFMSFFVKASIEALKLVPQVNAEIRGNDIVYKNYYDIGVAVGSGRGLVVPVLRGAERMSFAEIEKAIADFARRAQENKLKLEELEGGTFTISNGGIYGSLLSTPIVNPPQSGILGMHAIQDRPVARDGGVVIRPMMYVALTYDHRIVDGREAVTFLKRIKEIVEDPPRILLEI
ncbi:MAG TPA: dihydrolipoyllysine-residue succinyltransferase [Candidatus Acidoferrales bacterium]|nr:dihydrolipoyllysine-residue succinyltransferase [Candidatus Acidoferrales bacterium]